MLYYTTQNNKQRPVTSLDPGSWSSHVLLVRSTVYSILHDYMWRWRKKERRRSRSSFRTSDVGSQTLDRPCSCSCSCSFSWTNYMAIVSLDDPTETLFGSLCVSAVLYNIVERVDQVQPSTRGLNWLAHSRPTIHIQHSPAIYYDGLLLYWPADAPIQPLRSLIPVAALVYMS